MASYFELLAEKNFCFHGIKELSSILVEGTTQLEQFIDRQVLRIERLSPRFRVYSSLAPNLATSTAALEDQVKGKQARGPLFGVGVSVKGAIPVKGLPWTEGSRLYRNRIADQDARIVEAARQAGAIILGTTTLTELSMYAPDNPAEPVALNPWDPNRTPGGSSSGAGAAAALGLGMVNLGTDSGGSIRNPACHCGVVGFMPSGGKLSLERIPSYCPELDRLGIIARSVDDVRQAFDALRSDNDQARHERAPLFRVTLAVPWSLINEMCDDASLSIFKRVVGILKSGGAELVDASFDTDQWLQSERAAGVISLSAGARTLSSLDASLIGEHLRKRMEAGLAVSSEAVDEARDRCASFATQTSAQLRQLNAQMYLTPTWPFPAPLVTADTVDVKGKTVSVDPHRNCFVRAANAAGACAITLPSAMYEKGGVPAGIQLMAPTGHDESLLAVASWIEARLVSGYDWTPARS